MEHPYDPQTITMRLDYPPSVNKYWFQRNGYRTLTPKARAYREAASKYQHSRPMTRRIAILIEATMPDRRRRDIDNILKPILDAITHADIWVDDEQIDKLTITRIGVESPGCVDIYITEICPSEEMPK